MKTFTYIILSAIVASAAAINEPVASPTAAIERELAEYERQLGTDVTGSPTATPGRPTGGVSLLLYIFLSSCCVLNGEPWLQCMVYTAVG
eukprot:scaffold26973_cov89-Skeletonema_dohrnii-CCMP3373.AAC.3